MINKENIWEKHQIIRRMKLIFGEKFILSNQNKKRQRELYFSLDFKMSLNAIFDYSSH
jgi:hypothetical protein